MQILRRCRTLAFLKRGILCLVCIVTLPQAIFADADTSNLARVGILRFINNTQSENFEWVEQSLPDAIDLSMRARFEYVRLNQEQVQAAKEKVPPTENLSGGLKRFSQTDAIQIAQLSSADILIYGDFIVDESSQEIVLRSVIFNAASKQIIGRVEDRTPMNARIFRNIDQMAAEIVSEIYRYALQESQNAGRAKDNVKLLVLVPSYTNTKEEAQAKEELNVLKRELAARTPGKYLTIFEFYDEYHVTDQEQKKSLAYAKKRERVRLQLWLENYGVTDAMIVLVSENKVNITAIGSQKVAQVSYAVSATPEEKAKQLAAAQEKVQGKVELVKSDSTSDKKFTVSLGLGANHGLLLAGEHLGLITALNLFASMRMMRYLESHIRVDGYYGLAKGNVSSLVGGSVLSGVGITARFGRFALMPYIDGGLFMSRIDAKAGIFNVLLPSVGGGFSVAFMATPTWGLALQTHAQYVLDMDAPALFVGASLASVLRF